MLPCRSSFDYRLRSGQGATALRGVNAEAMFSTLIAQNNQKEGLAVIEHADGSVTLSEREFGSLALYCEVPRTKLKELLRSTGDNISQEDLQRLTQDLATLTLHRTDGEAH